MAQAREAWTDGHVRQGSKGPVPALWLRTPGAQVEPSRNGAADACRVVPRSLPRVPVGPAARVACPPDPRALWHTGPRRAEPLAAGRMRGEQLTGIHDPVGVEDAAQPGHEVQIGLAVLEREILGLVETHAVLARDRAAHRDTGVEQRLVCRLRALELLGVPVVVEDERVEVAVARVEDVGDLHAMARGDHGQLAHDLWKPRARRGGRPAR